MKTAIFALATVLGMSSAIAADLPERGRRSGYIGQQAPVQQGTLLRQGTATYETQTFNPLAIPGQIVGGALAIPGAVIGGVATGVGAGVGAGLGAVGLGDQRGGRIEGYRGAQVGIAPVGIAPVGIAPVGGGDARPCQLILNGRNAGPCQTDGDVGLSTISTTNDQFQIEWDETNPNRGIFQNSAGAPIEEVQANGGCWTGASVRFCPR